MKSQSSLPAHYPSARTFLPKSHSLRALRTAAEHCEGCPLFQRTTQTVFGQGTAKAQLVFVGEQPGDQEDLSGHPFVGPAGQLLDQLLAEAQIDRQAIYVTNAVKHFKWIPQGKRRLHSKPNARELQACRPWLEVELAAIQPQGIVCLGATTAQGFLGRDFRITRDRGNFFESSQAEWVMATYHPSAVLRAPDEAVRRSMRAKLLADLRESKTKLQ